MSDSVRPHRRQPTRLPVPGTLQAGISRLENTGVGCHFLLQCRKVKSESEVTQSCPTLATPWTAAYQAPPSMGFSRQEYWSGVPLPSPQFYASLSEILPTGKNTLQHFMCLCMPMPLLMLCHLFYVLSLFHLPVKKLVLLSVQLFLPLLSPSFMYASLKGRSFQM